MHWLSQHYGGGGTKQGFGWGWESRKKSEPTDGINGFIQQGGIIESKKASLQWRPPRKQINK